MLWDVFLYAGAMPLQNLTKRTKTFEGIYALETLAARAGEGIYALEMSAAPPVRASMPSKCRWARR